MKPTPNPTRAALQADPKIVKKTRRDNATFAFDGLPGEQDHEYLYHPAHGPQGSQRLEFGRPGL